MTDFELIEQAIEQRVRELQKLEFEIQEKLQMLDKQKQALSLLKPLLISVLHEPREVVVLEPDSLHHKPLGITFQRGNKIQYHHDT
jgi:hypothetical protein